ncbi:phage minor capsid protein [Streptomyces gardneri]|uniref:phage minor capsid protein n=1 Tax=Streptomyces gardneri TaxID=66892 RepID=UPI0037D4836C
MPIHTGMVEDLSASVRDLCADAEQRLLGVVARQLADGHEAPGWATAKLAAVQPMRRAAPRSPSSTRLPPRHSLKHLNCKHSTSSYLPGVTRAPAEHSEVPGGYEASPGQRAIERNVRKWKNRSAASTSPEGRCAAEARCGSGRSGSASTSTCTPTPSADANASSSAPETCPRTAAPPDVPEHRTARGATRSRRRASAWAMIAPCPR